MKDRMRPLQASRPSTYQDEEEKEDCEINEH